MIFADRVHNLLKRIARWYLGDETPTDPAQFADVYEDMLTQFANLYPNASRAQWHHFTMTLATMAFGDGRAFEQQLRLNEELQLGVPEETADKLDRNWRMSAPIDLANPDAVVPEEEMTEGELTDDFLRRASR